MGRSRHSEDTLQGKAVPFPFPCRRAGVREPDEQPAEAEVSSFLPGPLGLGVQGPLVGCPKATFGRAALPWDRDRDRDRDR